LRISSRGLVKGFAIISSILLALTLSIGSLIADMANNGIEIKRRNIECISVYKFFDPFNKTPAVYIKFRYCPHWDPVVYKGEIEAYTKQRLALLKWLYRHMPEEEFYAKVNFVRLLKLSEYEEFVKKYNLKPLVAEIIVFTKDGKFFEQGGGPGDVAELLSKYSERLRIMAEMRPWYFQGITLDDLEIMVGSFGIKANASLLYRLQQDPLVYLVDVGPRDIVLSYKAMGYAVYGPVVEDLMILILPRVTIDAYWTNISLTKTKTE